MFHLALYQPSIPPNTGNIGRLCAGMNTHLHIIGPCAFDFSNTSLKRAGLDYWEHLTWTLHEKPQHFLNWLGDREPWLVTKFAKTRYDQASFADEDILLLGNESSGLPEAWHVRWPHRALGIPMTGHIRSFNLANSAAILLSQAMSQSGGFDDIWSVEVDE